MFFSGSVLQSLDIWVGVYAEALYKEFAILKTAKSLAIHDSDA